ncbi:hypothetical protein [Xanthomarina gelatinilytica]|uniref:hypothetical protein n=1 Tax=Xanthomarina gelatinilytica TaxID=1137281 RepID=UPI003AA81BF1
MKYTPKYLGVLKGVDLGDDLFKEDNFELLIENKIIVRFYENDKSVASSRIFYDFEKAPFVYNDYTSYGYMLNNDFLDEAYQFIKNHVESLPNNTILWFINEEIIEYNLNDIKYLLESTLDISEKKSMLKNAFKEINTKCLDFKLERLRIKDDDVVELDENTTIGKLYSLLNYVFKRDLLRTYYNDDFPVRRLYFDFLELESNNPKKWKEWVYQRLESSDFIKEYLTNNDDLYDYEFIYSKHNPNGNYDLINIWSNFLVIKKTNDFINETIEELSKKTKTPTTTPKTTTTNLTFKELFKNPKEDCDLVLSQLIENNIIKKTNNKYEIIIPDKYKVKGTQFFICSIGMQLIEKGYFDKDYDGTAIAEAFNDFFINVKISKQNYNSLKDSPNQREYLKHTDFLRRK